jgi:hypothetical protein
MPTFNINDIIDKTLVAKTSVDLYRFPDDDSPSVYTVLPGQSVGKVESYFLPGANRSSIYWQFKDANGKFYYSEHKQGRYDVKELQEQGSLTLQQQQEQLQEASLTTSDKIFRIIQQFLLIGSGVYLLNTIIKKQK